MLRTELVANTTTIYDDNNVNTQIIQSISTQMVNIFNIWITKNTNIIKYVILSSYCCMYLLYTLSSAAKTLTIDNYLHYLAYNIKYFNLQNILLLIDQHIEKMTESIRVTLKKHTLSFTSPLQQIDQLKIYDK